MMSHLGLGFWRTNPGTRLFTCQPFQRAYQNDQRQSRTHFSHAPTITTVPSRCKHATLAAGIPTVTIVAVNTSPATRLHHLTLATRDVIASREFFLKTLRWEQIPRPGNIDIEAAWLDIGDGQQLHLLHVEEFVPSPFEAEFGRHFAFDYPLSEFQPLKERLLAHGAELIKPIRDTPFERFFFREPNGYIFEIVDADRKPEV